ncbi:MAG: threonine--tRNA ligase [Candidatus Woesearchaeota archaeon]
MKINYNGKIYETNAKNLLEFMKEVSAKGLVAEVNGTLYDLTTPLTMFPDGFTLNFYDFNHKKGREVFWHTSSHILAQAILRLFPNAKLAIGPAIDEGFYYDIDVSIKEEDLKKIEEEMKKIIKENLKIIREEIDYVKARELFKDNPYKMELIEEYKEEKLTIYRQGEFYDLCRGPHLPSTGYVGAIKIMKLAGAYWRGDSRNKMLTRIYGISFSSEKELNDYLTMLEEAKKRDHRVLGEQLDLFSFHEEGPGFVFWHFKGMILRNILMDLWRKVHYKQGYQEISTPIMLNEELWHRSGHWDHYRKNMYFTTIDEQIYAVKPMNCPGGILVYKSRPRSYREFPLKLGEFGLVHRHELSGVLHGLLRVRAFTQDDAHIYCEPENMKKEIMDVVKLIDSMYKIFGFSYHVEISTRPESRVGSDELWNLAESALEEVCKEMHLNYKINPGDGAFYGPKIDFHIKDSLGRTWQCATVQVDFNMPMRFELTYMGKDGTYNHTPVMLHRVVYGSLERFIGILIEHYAGKFPLWLNPVQVKILTVADRFEDKAKVIGKKLEDAGFRVAYDFEAMTINKKVRNAELEKVNYILVIGEKDNEENLAIRNRDGKVENKSLEEFINAMKEEINQPFKHLEIKLI